MKRIVAGLVFILGSFFLLALSNQLISKEPNARNIVQKPIKINIPRYRTLPFEKAVLYAFFKKYPHLKSYQSEVNYLYKKRK